MNSREADKNEWPLPKYDEADQPHFLFIITPPYAGSTALCELLNTSHRTMILQKGGEGQWLVPGMCGKNRWSPEMPVNYASVKAVWLNRYQTINRLVQNIDVVIEKSPPNMMRMEEIASQFRECSFIANNRNPYAFCASSLYRNNDADNMAAQGRKKLLGQLAKRWLSRSARVRELTNRLDVPLLTYERFCDDPSSLLDLLHLPAGVSETMNLGGKITVKDYGPQVICNQNQRQIAMLTSEEIAHIGRLLRPSEELLDFFGYECLAV